MANTTWNPSDKGSGVTLSGTNNLTLTTNALASQYARTIDRNATGKFYWEYTFNAVGGVTLAGIATAATVFANVTTAGYYYVGIVSATSGAISINNVGGPTLGAFSAGGTACFALDIGAQLLWIRSGAAGNWNNSATANPATGAGGLSIASFVAPGIPVYGFGGTYQYSAGSLTANFGDTAFVGTVPSGFTSGFTSGASPPLYAIDTQIALEQWAAPATPAVQMTQAAIEQWATVATGNVQAIMTQMAVEQWASVTLSAAAARQAGVWIMA